MKPGRKPISRAERLRLGLPVCIASETCDRAPTHPGPRCSACYASAPRTRHRRGVPVAHVQYSLPPDLALAISLEAARRRIYPGMLVELVMGEAAKGWGSTPVRVVGPGPE